MFPAATPANLVTAVIAMNFIAFAAFGIDKAKAERGGWRMLAHGWHMTGS
jgi:uncharacterized membrane protein YsdA (DUF1294 family)